MEERDISLIWISTDMDERYLALLNNDFRSDVTFIVGSDRRRVPGHSFILVFCTWEFYNIFELLKLDSYEFIIPDVQYDSFMAFLKYCYTLKFNLNCGIRKTLEILKLAQKFTFLSLIEICEKHILQKISRSSCMVVYENRQLFSDSQVVQKALVYLQKYFSSIIQQSRDVEIFLDLPLEAVRDVAKLSPINCDEMQLFDVLMKWAKRNCENNGIPPSSRNLRMILKDVFYEIRFPIMKSTWIPHIIANYLDMFTKEEITHICKKINGHEVYCPGFNCNPRQTVKFVIQSISLGYTVMSFTGIPSMNNGTTRKMTSRFGAKTTIKLIGFAFVTKKGEEVNVTSCKIRISNSTWKNIATSPAVDGRSQFTWDYDLIVIKLDESQEIIPTTDPKNYNVELECEFDNHVPILASKESVLNNRFCCSDICLPCNDPNTIPYLILMRQ